ncbi:HlyD family secretion protein [Aquirufa antheringensis]|uniref:HlyD family efflux transporter periplasmic adaptor subunit n=1 Tax=Aquirufa antheringensis TaxID=2516559 RepID=A0A4V6MRK7_9BACT|nr:HlyD family secretion protein [Aquirufa antheringensis]MCZ2484823.1 HlyD family efflux transporter periplasmic adaptor subunit [Aquirufa antheringensis]TBH75135.1 HlyD family efflux transporter periplasmic adaptor subunit [Aquirufa antheringensis]
MEKFKSFNQIYLRDKGPATKPWLIGLGLILLGVLFLPWTQNIRSKGQITSLYQEQKPQKIYSPIAGKISRWWVKEGDFVEQGDTLAKISEIKAEYLDPKLISRTQEQLDAKKGTVSYYEQKVKSTEDQIANLRSSKALKQDQLNNKITALQQKLTGEKAELEAASNEYNLIKDQFERNQKMYKEGLISQTQFQQRNASMQNSLAKKTTAENKVNQTLQEIQNTKIELRGVDQEYSEKMNKAEGEKFQSLGMIETGKGDVAKLENQVASYTIRDGMYYILAPQSGQVINAKKAGIGEILKDGEELLTIVPQNTHYAVEMYVRPVDLPLVSPGQDVRFIFDGFPAIIFAGGWPDQSFGTFPGKIRAIENNIDEKGMFRVIVVENPKDKKWPKQIKMGAGAQGITLLNDVPLWYELWRNINGFPADFYTVTKDEK